MMGKGFFFTDNGMTTETSLNTPLILVVDDDNRLRRLLQKYLTENGFRVFSAADTKEADALMRWFVFDLLVVDVMMPVETGIEFTERLRAKNENVPVLMLTALGETGDRISGLESGADDYLVKPFHIRELLARIRALTRRPVEIQERKTITAYGLVLDAEYRRLTYQGKSVILTQKETNLITVFLEQPDTVQSRSQLLWKVWGGNTEVEDGNVDNYIHFLRKRLRELGCKVSIKTVYGAGYRLEETP